MPIYMPKIEVRYHSISEILTITEYWNLIGREPFLAITWELDFSQACSFCRMLMSHKKFHFTQSSDKTNDLDFIKKYKNHALGSVLTIFVHFCPMGIFSKNLALSHTIYGSLTQCIFSEKTNEPIPRKLTDRRKDGRMDGQTLFHRTLPAEGPIRYFERGLSKRL